MAQLFERATEDRVVAVSNPTEVAWKRWQFRLPHFASVFRKRPKPVGPSLLSGVYARGSKIFHTGGKLRVP